MVMGVTALMVASSNGRSEAVKLLLQVHPTSTYQPLKSPLLIHRFHPSF